MDGPTTKLCGTNLFGRLGEILLKEVTIREAHFMTGKLALTDAT